MRNVMQNREMTAAERDLLERWQGWQRSIEERDVAAADGYLDDAFALELVVPQGTMVPRASWLETLPEYVVSSYAIHERFVDVDGDLGVILHRATMLATMFRADRSGTFVITDVWRRRNDVWRVWRRHSTPFQAGPMLERSGG
jgi:hypothetical protein